MLKLANQYIRSRNIHFCTHNTHNLNKHNKYTLKNQMLCNKENDF